MRNTEYVATNDKLQGTCEAGWVTSAPMLRQCGDASDAIGAAALIPEDQGPAGSGDGEWW